MLLSGVIEGFYGPPWSLAERLSLLDRMQASGLDTYQYGPKDDLHHRSLWREPYRATEAADLGTLVAAAHQRGIRFVYGIGPGLDFRYLDESDHDCLRNRCAQLLTLGADGIALLFDDIPDRVDAATLTRWGSLAAAQAEAANRLCAWVRAKQPDAVVAFCPTPYCGRMADAQLGGAGYLETLGAALRPDIEVFWTGPDIVSREITVAHVREVTARLQRPPLLWDNLHANDYDGRRMFCGPYAGRPLALRDHVRGILSNPNTECPLNHVPVRTLGAFVHATEAWDARAQFLAALEEWQPAFETVEGPVPFDDLVLLADCFYLPYEEGPRAVALRDAASRALTDAGPGWRSQAEAFLVENARLRELCGRLTALRDRPLFHALHRRLWDLREELDLLGRAVEARLASGGVGWSVQSDFHRLGTYRGGMVTALESLLTRQRDGSFVPSSQQAPPHDI